MNDSCPISFIPVHEILHKVTFTTDRRIIYNAEDLIAWLKHYSLVVPITNAQISPGFANELLRPHDPGDQSTVDLLKQAGYLDGAGGNTPNLFFRWIRGNPIQRTWISVFVISTAMGFLLATSNRNLDTLHHHITKQCDDPLDIYNALTILKFTFRLSPILILLFLLWIVICLTLNWIIQHTIEIVQLTFGISITWITYTALCFLLSI